MLQLLTDLMPIWKHYLLPKTVHEALNALATAHGPARLIAGGTDLLLDLQQDRLPALDLLVDVTAIPELNLLELRKDQLFIGAAVSLTRIAESPLVAQHGQALVEACGLIGGPQVRNTATLGGNVGHALPAADGTIALLALDACAEVVSLTDFGMLERRHTPLANLFLGPGKSSLNPQKELLVGFFIPLCQPGAGSAFARVRRPQGVALPILNMAAWIQRTREGTAGFIHDVRISIGPAGPVPQRGREAEERLRGQPFGQAAFAQALDALLEEVHFRTSPRRATADYRRHLSVSLFNHVLTNAWERAGASLSLPTSREILCQS